MPKVVRASGKVFNSSSAAGKARGTIGQYFATQHCPVCEQLTLEGICSNCKTNPRKVVLTLTTRLHQDEMTSSEIAGVSIF